MTAVEWLIEQLTPSISLQSKYIQEFKEQALAMEKQQIIDAANIPMKDRWYDATKFSNIGEQHYSKTYVKSNI